MGNPPIRNPRNPSVLARKRPAEILQTSEPHFSEARARGATLRPAPSATGSALRVVFDFWQVPSDGEG
eukprot:15456543-Alexandrium_andersonii.AAC.1